MHLCLPVKLVMQISFSAFDLSTKAISSFFMIFQSIAFSTNLIRFLLVDCIGCLGNHFCKGIGIFYKKITKNLGFMTRCKTFYEPLRPLTIFTATVWIAAAVVLCTAPVSVATQWVRGYIGIGNRTQFWTVFD